MPSFEFTDDELLLAWKRAKDDWRENRCFVDHPLLPSVVDIKSDEWLTAIKDTLADGTYTPGPSSFCQAPKGGGLVRTATILSTEDYLVYQLIVGKIRNESHTLVDWGTPAFDYANVSKADLDDTSWYVHHYKSWNSWNRSIPKFLNKGYHYVVVADIAAYYDNIDVNLLRSDIGDLYPNELVGLLAKCLDTWGRLRLRGRGIPQGCSPSHYLSKIYLNEVDHCLAGEGIDHAHYNDDYRIFCETERDAKQSLMLLTEHLSRKGLSLQSAKTKILPINRARPILDRVQRTIDPLKEEIQISLFKSGLIQYPSQPVYKIDEVLREHPDATALRTVRLGYKDNVEKAVEIDKSVFNFLMRRLTAARDQYAFPHCLNLLYSHPELTESILRYISSIDKIFELEDFYLALVSDSSNIYEYQDFQILRWRSTCTEKPSDDFLIWMRAIAFSTNRPWYIRAYARMLVHRWGNYADSSRFIDEYKNNSGVLGQIESICYSSKVDKLVRNAFFGRVKNTSWHHDAAIEMVKTDRVPG